MKIQISFYAFQSEVCSFAVNLRGNWFNNVSRFIYIFETIYITLNLRQVQFYINKIPLERFCRFFQCYTKLLFLDVIFLSCCPLKKISLPFQFKCISCTVKLSQLSLTSFILSRLPSTRLFRTVVHFYKSVCMNSVRNEED